MLVPLGQGEAEVLRDLAGDIGLKSCHVPGLALELGTPEAGAGLRVDELGVCGEGLGAPTDAAEDHRFHAERSTDLARIVRVTL